MKKIVSLFQIIRNMAIRGFNKFKRLNNIESRIQKSIEIEGNVKSLISKIKTEIDKLEENGLSNISWNYQTILQVLVPQSNTVEKIKEDLEKERLNKTT